MKSVRLSKEIRNNIAKAMLDAWEKNSPPPCNLSEENKKLGDELYDRCYPNLNVNGIPIDMLKRRSNIMVDINGSVREYPMSETRPVRMQGMYTQLPNKSFPTTPAIVTAFERKKEAFERWASEKNSFEEEVLQILNSVNTTKQLCELWPEAESYLPPYASDPSKGIKLPALKTSRLNEALGLKDAK
jgi:hypothetical protein